MTLSSLIVLFGIMQIAAMTFAFIKSGKGKKLESLGLTLLGSSLVWLLVLLFAAFDAKSHKDVLDTMPTIQMLCIVVGNVAVPFLGYALSRKTK